MKANPLCRILSILTLTLLLTASDALAMTFSQPVEIGLVGGTPPGGLTIDGANWNNGSLFHISWQGHDDTTFQGDTLYKKGVAQFGDEAAPLYFYYDWDPAKCRGKARMTSATAFDSCCVFSDKNQTKTKAKGMDEGDSCTIFRIPTNDHRVLYLLKYTGCVAGLETYVLMGYQSNGTFVKYFDTSEILPGYYGTDRQRRRYIWLENAYCQGDTIVVEYLDTYQKKHYNRNDRTGAFRFRWDDNAQWFGVEHVFY
ncbi:hypothetical protein [uncultured Selenomonas sp.]|uniref:hypothetical protein n=1 Tax=uncultured Selenomonas sp. TaxID=159275 RepID=UPI0025F2E8B7|nr:hypothetical protein [uncultured Selenomonas sp.]